MLSWDVLVLSGYLLINLHVTGYLVYHRFIGKHPRKRWYLPFVFLSVVWAVSIHSVTAFLYSGLGGRPFWNTAILAPRFIMSAFVTGPAFLILTLKLIDRLSPMRVPDGPEQTLASILRVTVLGNLFMVGSEAFTQFYTGGHHVVAAEYLYFGTHGHHALVPWIWSAMALNTLGAGLLLWGQRTRNPDLALTVACVAVFCGVWIEKGMGLIIPGFVPSTLHELVEYLPSLAEWKISAGIWAFGLGLYTVAIKVTAQMLTGNSRLQPHSEAVTDSMPPPEAP
jgi:molybdopterin-containing oxidoreductase family membrane subunit